ncbi:hypothetical protein BDA96_04G211200 [Sorghum bicolor]|uniref:Uncharacterized protein n=2 Tax=Sorghum bicolor TaxID=4558 RepID=A0A921UL14_SORBI|nr:hypothetical protein BDA96_04G211200 [Sorghum bicolor]OQU85233.1 hypothetical protein SORBI_3004G198701 [Sorghum bicolor]
MAQLRARARTTNTSDVVLVCLLQQRPKCFSRRPAGLPPRSDNGPTRAPVLPNGPLQHSSCGLCFFFSLRRAGTFFSDVRAGTAHHMPFGGPALTWARANSPSNQLFSPPKLEQQAPATVLGWLCDQRKIVFNLSNIKLGVIDNAMVKMEYD